MDPRDMGAKELLDAATKRIFSLGPRDLASALAYENMRYGLGKIMYALDDLDAFCVFGPDATITRNIERWNNGFGYGAVIRWPERGVYFPGLRPNACGMLLARIEKLPSKEELIERIANVGSSDLYLDDVRVRPDFGHGNHFLEFYSVLESSPEVEDDLPKESHYVLLHGSAPEKKGSFYGFMDSGEIETPLGSVSMLEDAAGREYHRAWEDLEDYSKRRRELLLKEIVGEYKTVSNITHQGIFRKNEVRLGCYDTMRKDSDNRSLLFPVALRWDVPVYVFKGNRNLSEEVIGRVGFDERAQEVGMKEQLTDVNILPHGGGYRIDLEYTKINVIKNKAGNHFILSGSKPVSRISEMMDSSRRGISSFGEVVVMNPRELPYDYRGMSVIEKTMEYNLGTPVAKLQPLMTFKV